MRGAFVLGIALLAVSGGGCVQTQVSALQEKCDFSNDPRFVVLRGKIPLRPQDNTASPTLEEISDKSVPNAVERQALIELDSASAFCRRGALDIASHSAPPAVVGLMREADSALLNQRMMLANGKISFGQFRQNQYKILGQTERVAGQYLQSQQAADAAKQQAAAAQLSATVQTLQAFNRQSTVTNCSALGSTVSCVTH